MKQILFCFTKIKTYVKISTMKKYGDKIVKYGEESLPLKAYSCVDNFNNEITVQVPNPERHTPHDIYNDPAIHYNVGFAIQNFDNKKAGRHREGGEVTVFECYDFYEKTNHPRRHTKPNYTLTTAVFYSYDGENYTLTYYDRPNGGNHE